jgi:methyltransferase (TIGR00027 family)
MKSPMTRSAAVTSAETLATLRAVVSNETRLAVRCEDPLAIDFVEAKNRFLVRILPQFLLRGLFDRMAPGSYCFTIARTRHFDEALLAACRAGVEQVVLLGAGYDSRPFRFVDELAKAEVFDVDHPGTQARKRAILQGAARKLPANLRFVPVDLTTDSLEAALSGSGFTLDRRTIFLWEGVSYYLPQAAVERVLQLVARCGPSSSIMFDYAIQSFIDGDHSTYGGQRVAQWLKKIDEPFLFGLDPSQTSEFLSTCGLRLISDLGPAELERLYLGTRRGGPLGRTLGHVRIAHAQV